MGVDDDHGGRDRDRIFERFVRLDEARTLDDGGTGLGLAITRVTLRAHGGDAVVSDGPGAGAASSSASPAPPTAPAHQGGSKHTMLARSPS